MTIHCTDPIRDPRWRLFVARHPRASVFHTPEWLEALRRTYGYQAVVFTTDTPGRDLTNGLVLCRVQSWLTGRRAVTLPFSDHCDPLVDDDLQFQFLVAALKCDLDATKTRYLEIRSLMLPGVDLVSLDKAEIFYLHKLDLRPCLDEIFGGFHKNCIQRKIRRAERESLRYEEGNSATLLGQFYRLVVMTRRRHQLPPPPIAWYRNLITCMGDKLKIRLASKDSQPVAGILTLQYKDTMIYKYGCSDTTFNSLGGIHLLLWRSIEESKKKGLRIFDFGRSDRQNQGLIVFKDRWGAQRSVLTYFKLCGSFAAAQSMMSALLNWSERSARTLLPLLPDRVLCATGAVLYKHIGDVRHFTA